MKVRREQEQQQNLGETFGDPSLDCRFEGKDGRVQKLYHFQLKDGQTNLTCVACGVTVTGKRNLDVHISGKRHKFTMADLKTLGKEFERIYASVQDKSAYLFFSFGRPWAPWRR